MIQTQLGAVVMAVPQCVAYKDGCPTMELCASTGRCQQAQAGTLFTHEQVEAGRRKLNGRTISQMLVPANMADWYRAIRALELNPPASPTTSGQLDDLTQGRSRPDDRVLSEMERRAAAILDAVRQVGFGEANAHYVTTDGDMELSIRLSVRGKIVGERDDNGNSREREFR